MPSFTAMIDKGAIRPIGVTSPSASTPLKDLPLISQTVPEFTDNSWNAIFTTARTPRLVVDKVFAAKKTASTDKRLQKRFDEQGVDLALAGPAELLGTVQRETLVWDRAVREAKIEIN